MRIFTVMCLISIIPVSSAFATDSDYHYVRYGDTTKGPDGVMGYWDDGGYAKNLLPMNLTDSGSHSRLDYSTPQDNSTPQCSAASSSPSDSIIAHSRPDVQNVPDNSQNKVQP